MAFCRVAVVKETFTCGRLAMEVLQMMTATVMATLPVYTQYLSAVSVIMASLLTTLSCAHPPSQ